MVTQNAEPAGHVVVGISSVLPHSAAYFTRCTCGVCGCLVLHAGNRLDTNAVPADLPHPASTPLCHPITSLAGSHSKNVQQPAHAVDTSHTTPLPVLEATTMCHALPPSGDHRLGPGPSAAAAVAACCPEPSSTYWCQQPPQRMPTSPPVLPWLWPQLSHAGSPARSRPTPQLRMRCQGLAHGYRPRPPIRLQAR